MVAKCEITGLGRAVGHKVSHSQIKTKRTFKVNLQSVAFFSQALNRSERFKVAVKTVRSVEANGGIDSYLLKKSNSELTDKAIGLKKQIKKALEGQINGDKPKAVAETQAA